MDESGPILLFDGVCNVCNGVVNYVIDHDPDGRFRFASLQSDAGRKLLAAHGLADLPPLSTSVLIEGDRAYVDSEGILRTALRLGGAFKLVAPLLLLPRGLRDPLYRAFVARRYRWFGKTDSCRVPTPEIHARFLDGA